MKKVISALVATTMLTSACTTMVNEQYSYTLSAGEVDKEVLSSIAAAYTNNVKTMCVDPVEAVVAANGLSNAELFTNGEWLSRFDEACKRTANVRLTQLNMPYLYPVHAKWITSYTSAVSDQVAGRITMDQLKQRSASLYTLAQDELVKAAISASTTIVPVTKTGYRAVEKFDGWKTAGLVFGVLAAAGVAYGVHECLKSDSCGGGGGYVAPQRYYDPEYPCDYPHQYARDGSRCGDRAASVRPGGRF